MGSARPASLAPHELRALRRSAAQFPTEAKVRTYLALSGPLPVEATAHLGSARSQRLRRWRPLAEGLEFGATAAGVLLGGGAVAFGSVVVWVLALTGDPEVQEAAHVFAFAALILVLLSSASLLMAALIEERWVRSGLLAVVVALAAVPLAHADPTRPIIFG